MWEMARDRTAKIGEGEKGRTDGCDKNEKLLGSDTGAV